MKFSTEGYIQEQRRRLAELLSGKAMGIAVQNTHVKQMERIFEEGDNSKGGNIGKYNSTDPIYVNPSTSPKSFPTKGKTGKTKFQDGKSHKTGYFESYKEYRQKIGRETGSVNLVLSGQLQSDLSNGLKKISPSNWVAAIKNPANKDKIDGAEDRYGKIFDLTKKERENFKDILQFESVKILRGDA
jgi:hypothetical protein